MDVTSSTLIIALVLSTLVGGSLGLLGGGGSILTTPILLYVLGMSSHEAIATSLLVVASTSAAALIPHGRGGRVRWGTGALFGLTSMVGAYAAGRLAHLVPGSILLLAFGAMMVATAVAMLRKKKAAAAGDETRADAGRPVLKIVFDGLVVGAVTGLVGAGGGFLVVPALVVLGGLPMREAVGTSLLVISMKAFAAFAGHLGQTPVDFDLAAMVTGAAILGSFAGSAFAGRMRQDLLRRSFAWFVVVMAVFLLSQEIPKALGYSIELRLHWPWILGLVSVPSLIALFDLRRLLRQPEEGSHAALPRPMAP